MTVDIEKEEALDKSLNTSSRTPQETSLIIEGNELTDKIIGETDVDKIGDLTKLFEVNKRKRDIARTNKLNNLLSIIDDEVVMRFTSYPDSFDNDQLMKYMTATQQSISNISQTINQVPQIQINNQTNEIHVGTSGLNRESRAKVLDVVQQILKSADIDNNVIDANIKEK